MKSTISEVFDQINAARFNGDRVFILKKNDSMALRGLLRMQYDSSLVIDLPPGVPPYTKKNVPVGFGDSTLLTSARTWYVFSKSSSPNLPQSKREFLFITLLEALDPKEAEILLLAKDRKLKLNLTTKVINEAFPGLIHVASDDSKMQNDELIVDHIAGENAPEKKRGRGRPRKS